jgi:hypothetical protein
MLGMTRGIQKFLLGLPGSRIWRKKLKNFFLGKISKAISSSKIKVTSRKLCTYVGHDSGYALEFFGPSRIMCMAKKIKKLFFGENFKSYLLLQNESHNCQTLHICWA